jgi:hypothetical protein
MQLVRTWKIWGRVQMIPAPELGRSPLGNNYLFLKKRFFSRIAIPSDPVGPTPSPERGSQSKVHDP